MNHLQLDVQGWQRGVQELQVEDAHQGAEE